MRREKLKSGYVLYDATPEKYTVHAYDVAGVLITAYTAGNHAGSSQDFVPVDSPQAVPFKTMLKYAKQSAFELAKENGIPKTRVQRDTDILERKDS